MAETGHAPDKKPDVLIGALFAGLFVADLLLPLVDVMTVFYLLLMISMFLYRLGLELVWVATAVSLLMALDVFWHREELAGARIILEQAMALAGVWLGAGLLHKIGLDSILDVHSDAVLRESILPILVVTPTGEIRLANTEACKLFGYNDGELDGQPLNILLPPQARRDSPDMLARFFEDPKPMTVGADRNIVGVKKSGGVVPLDFLLNPVETNAGPVVMAILHDISAYRNIETNLMRVNKELENFAYVASHDLRAPLRGIANAARWLEEDLGEQLSGENLEHLKMLQQRSARMGQFLDDLLDYSRIGHSMDSRYNERVPAADILETVVEMLPLEKRVELQRAGDWSGIELVRMPLERVLLNLLDNAIKHGRGQELQVEVGIRDEGPSCEIWVRDNGPGIAPEYHERIFEMFQTLRPRDEVEGSGMGLAIVKKTIETFGGSVFLESAIGKGSTFRLHWPKVPIKLEQPRRRFND